MHRNIVCEYILNICYTLQKSLKEKNSCCELNLNIYERIGIKIEQPKWYFNRTLNWDEHKYKLGYKIFKLNWECDFIIPHENDKHSISKVQN